MCCVSLFGYTWQLGLICTGINLQTLQDKDLILTLEKNIRGGTSSVMGARYVETVDKKNCTLMLVICMGGLCQNHCLMMKLNLIEMLN